MTDDEIETVLTLPICLNCARVDQEEFLDFNYWKKCDCVEPSQYEYLDLIHREDVLKLIDKEIDDIEGWIEDDEIKTELMKERKIALKKIRRLI